MSAVIVDASIRHLDRLHEIETECFKDEAFTREQIARLLKDYDSIGFVACVGNKIVGFVISMIYIDRNDLQGHILTIDVLPDYRRKGIGQMLIQETERILKQKGAKASRLEVKEDNYAAINLYKKLGYEKVGKLKNYYGNSHGIYLNKALT
jgi:ribosomal-protein-alanine acetyltransferase